MISTTDEAEVRSFRAAFDGLFSHDQSGSTLCLARSFASPVTALSLESLLFFLLGYYHILDDASFIISVCVQDLFCFLPLLPKQFRTLLASGSDAAPDDC